MLTDQEINTHFVSLIPLLRPIVKGVAYKQKKSYIEEDAAINEAYIYIIENKHLLISKDTLQRIAINFINKSIIWNNSKLSTVERINNQSDSPYIPDQIDDDSDILDKIATEKWYADKKCEIVMYRAQEKNKIKSIIFDCYFEKGITKGTDLAKHLGINKDYSSKYIREMKHDIREFVKNLNNEKIN
jgi:hypothetical protein